MKATIRIRATEAVYVFRVDAAAAVAAHMVMQPRLDNGTSVSFEATPHDSDQMAVHIRVTPSTELVVEDNDPEETEVKSYVTAFETMLSQGVPLMLDSDGRPFELPDSTGGQETRS